MQAAVGATVGRVRDLGMNEDAFARRRSLLFTVAYEMLGSASDAEDVVQEAWLRWSNVDHADVRDPRAYLVGIVTRQTLNRLRSLARRREDYVGEWLPEPLLTSPDVAADVELAESVSIAMLTVLETLAAGRARGVRASLSSDRLEMLVDRSIRIGRLGHLTRLSDAQLADRRRQDRHRAGSDTLAASWPACASMKSPASNAVLVPSTALMVGVPRRVSAPSSKSS